MRGCSEGRALNKAERMGVYRARIVSAGREYGRGSRQGRPMATAPTSRSPESPAALCLTTEPSIATPTTTADLAQRIGKHLGQMAA